MKGLKLMTFYQTNWIYSKIYRFSIFECYYFYSKVNFTIWAPKIIHLHAPPKMEASLEPQGECGSVPQGLPRNDHYLWSDDHLWRRLIVSWAPTQSHFWLQNSIKIGFLESVCHNWVSKFAKLCPRLIINFSGTPNGEKKAI